MPDPSEQSVRPSETPESAPTCYVNCGSTFDRLERRQKDPIFDVITAFRADTRAELSPGDSPSLGSVKVNLSTGVNLGEHGEPALYGMQSVRQALGILFGRYEAAFAAAAKGDLKGLLDIFGYLPTTGLPAFCAASEALLLGADSPIIKAGRANTIQTVGGTGALAVGAAFLRFPARTPEGTAPLFSGPVYCSDNGWPNHRLTFNTLGYEYREYPYYDKRSHSVRFDDLKACIESAPSGSVFVLQLSGHNSSSFDLNKAQFAELAQVFSRRPDIIPFFDAAYAGLANGFAEDTWPLKHFAEQGVEFLVAHSFSKSLEAYGLRLGTLSVVRRVAASAESIDQLGKAQAVASKALPLEPISGDELLSILADGASRALVSNCPRFGAELASIIFSNAQLHALFDQELVAKAARCRDMRGQFADHMQELGFPEYDYVRNGSVMFALLDDVAPEDTPRLEELGIFMYANRLVVPRLNSTNLNYVCRALAQLFTEKRSARSGPDLDTLA